MIKKGLEAEYQQYFAQEKIDIKGTSADPKNWIYRLADSKVYVREFEIESGLGGEPVDLVAIGDMHLNALNEEDEQNEELIDTQKHRFWNANAASIPATVRAMNFAKFFDQTIVVGDTLDFMSLGCIELTEEYVWGADQETIIVLGGHDVTREMQTRNPDKDSLEDRYAYVAKYWHHDVYYVSKIIRDKVMVIGIDNGQHSYWPHQVEKLRKDIELAREKNLSVLIFQHDPMMSRNPEENPLIAIRGNDGNKVFLYDKAVGANADEVTAEVYRLMTENADVVRAIFCGHWHGDYYSEILGSYTDAEGNVHPTKIPQLILTGNSYDDYSGHVMRIKVR